MSANSHDVLEADVKAHLPSTGTPRGRRRNSWIGTTTFEVHGEMIEEKEAADSRDFELDFLVRTLD